MDPYQKLNQELLKLREPKDFQPHPKISTLYDQVDQDFRSSRARASEVLEYIKRKEYKDWVMS
jgi:hypothetical protein